MKEGLTKTGCTPHYTIELSKVELLTMNNKIITVSDMQHTMDDILNYSTIKHGSNVKFDGIALIILPESKATHY